MTTKTIRTRILEAYDQKILEVYPMQSIGFHVDCGRIIRNFVFSEYIENMIAAGFDFDGIMNDLFEKIDSHWRDQAIGENPRGEIIRY